MATIVKTPSGNWKAVIRKTGQPTTAKTFRTKRDAQYWALRTEGEMMRGVYIQRSASKHMTLEASLKRYLADVIPTKKPSTPKSERQKATTLIEHVGKYSLATLTPKLIANYRDTRLNTLRQRGQPISPNTVRLELALLDHLYTVVIQEWGLGLIYNSVQNIRKPSPEEGRDRRLNPDEEKRLFAMLRQHSNSVLAWVARIALETGMRSSEILTLIRSQVDANLREVLLTDINNNEARLVPLTQAATEVFKPALNDPVRPINCDLVFCGEDGKGGKRGPYAYTKAWNETKKKARLDDIRFQDLRHEVVSRLVKRVCLTK